MTKREALLRERLATAHRFIYGQMRHAENYGSNFSSSMFIECEAFLKHNKPMREPAYVVVPRHRYQKLCAARLAQLRAGRKTP